MLSKVKITAIAVSALATVSMNTNANQVSVEQIVTNLVQSAVVTAANELENSVQQSVLNTSHQFTLGNERLIKTKVSITDLAAKQKQESNEVEKKQQNAE